MEVVWKKKLRYVCVEKSQNLPHSDTKSILYGIPFFLKIWPPGSDVIHTLKIEFSAFFIIYPLLGGGAVIRFYKKKLHTSINRSIAFNKACPWVSECPIYSQLHKHKHCMNAMNRSWSTNKKVEVVFCDDERRELRNSLFNGLSSFVIRIWFQIVIVLLLRL